jgi:hypothetical protein
MWRFAFGKRARKQKCETEQRAAVRFLTRKGLKAKEVEMELTSAYGDEAFQISAVKKWRTRFLPGRKELGDDP